MTHAAHSVVTAMLTRRKKYTNTGFPYPVYICKVIRNIYMTTAGSYVGCSKLSDPRGQMVDHSGHSYFKTHVINNSQAQ